MTMMEAWLDFFEKYYEHFPLSLSTVLLLGAFCLVLLFFSFREFWTWFNKTSGLKRSLRELKAQIGDLEVMVKEIHAATSQASPQSGSGGGGSDRLRLRATESLKGLEPSEENLNEKIRRNAFPLNH